MWGEAIRFSDRSHNSKNLALARATRVRLLAVRLKSEVRGMLRAVRVELRQGGERVPEACTVLGAQETECLLRE